MKKLIAFFLLIGSITSLWGQNSSPFYLVEPAKFNSQLLQNTIIGLGKDASGMLWVLSQYGCYRFDGHNTDIHLVNNTPFLGSDRYRCLLKDDKGERMIAVGDLDYYFIKKGKLIKKNNADSILICNNYNFLLLPRKRLELNDNFKNKSIFNASIFFFPSDTLFNIEGRFFNYTKNRFVASPVFKSSDNNNLLYRNGLNYKLDQKGLKVLTLINDNIKITRVLALPGFNHIIPNNDLKSIWVENENEIKKISLPSLKISTTIEKNNIGSFTQSILEDEETGILYWGTVKNGVYVIRANKIRKLGSENYTNSYCYSKILNSYCITTGKGITYFNKPNEPKESFLKQKDLYNLYLYTDAQQRIWYQNSKANILLLNPKTNILVDSIPFNDFMSIVKQIGEQHFIIGNHQTVFHYQINTKQRDTLFTLPPNQAINDGVFTNKINYIATNNGLYVLNPKYKIVRHLLPGVTLRKSILLPNQLLALGSYGKGFYLLKNNKLYTASIEKYPQLSAVTSLSLDDEGALWVICNKAAFVWNHPDIINNNIPPPDHILQVDSDLPCNELNGGLNPDVFPNHEIALPSSDGLLIFKKQDLIRKSPNTPISIGKIILGDSLLEWVTKFTLPAGSPDLKFFIDAANLEYNSQIETEYRLLGLDSNWSSLQETRVLEFSRLPPGKYQLELRKSRGVKPEMLSSFNVNTYWYQTPWANLLFLLSLVAIVYVIVVLRIRSQKRYQKKLESIIDEKTKSLRENVNKLNASEKELIQQHRYRNKLYSILMHDLKSPLTFLSTFSIQQFTQKKPVEKESMQIIAKSSSELSSFINEFLFWLGNQTNPDTVIFQKINLSELLFEQAEFYQNFATINNNRIFYFEREKNIDFITDIERLKIVIRNLLDNANKYTINGIIKISHYLDDHKNTIIIIQDSGKGLPENIANLINQSSSAESITLSINANHKMGLMISKELLAQINGKIKATSNENTGTQFTITLASKNRIH